MGQIFLLFGWFTCCLLDQGQMASAFTAWPFPVEDAGFLKPRKAEVQEKPEKHTDGPQASEQEDFNADPEPDTRGQIAEPKCATGKCETNVVQERRTEETPAAAMTQMSFSSVRKPRSRTRSPWRRGRSKDRSRGRQKSPRSDSGSDQSIVSRYPSPPRSTSPALTVLLPENHSRSPSPEGWETLFPARDERRPNFGRLSSPAAPPDFGRDAEVTEEDGRTHIEGEAVALEEACNPSLKMPPQPQVETCADKWYKASKGAKELGVELELKRHKLALKEMPILQQAVEELIRLRKNDWSNSKWLGKRGYHYGEKAGGVLLGAGLGGLGVAGDLTHMAGAAIMDAAGRAYNYLAPSIDNFSNSGRVKRQRASERITGITWPRAGREAPPPAVRDEREKGRK